MSETLYPIYVLNLVITVAMFVVLVFRARIELKHYNILWKEIEWRKSCEASAKILKAEKELFSKVDGGEELYEALLKLFQTYQS